jgi:hypothetical protein
MSCLYAALICVTDPFGRGSPLQAERGLEVEGRGEGALGLRPPVYRGFGPPRRRTLIIVFIALGQWWRVGGGGACQTVCLCPTTQPQCMGYTIHPHAIPTKEKIMDREMAQFDLFVLTICWLERRGEEGLIFLKMKAEQI